jgi:hypothetical protein
MVHCDPLSVLYTWVCRMLSDRDVSKSRFFGLTPLQKTRQLDFYGEAQILSKSPTVYSLLWLTDPQVK